MAKVLFLNPVVRQEDSPRHLPYGIALLAAIIRDKGHQVAIFDANAHRQPISKIKEVCLADKWDVIAIGGLTTTYGFIKQAVKIIRETCPKTLLVAGGGFLTSMPREVMEWLPEIDVGIVGEGFQSFPMVVEGASEVAGTISRYKGEIHINGTMPLVQDLDTLPFPAWELLPLEIYFKNSQAFYSEAIYNAKRRIDINGSYGCSLVCKFCWHLGTIGDMSIHNNDVRFSYNRELRWHSAEYIGEMVKELQKRYQVDFVTFLDENLMTMHTSSRKKWLYEICDVLEPLNIKWSGTSHASLAYPDILRRMAETGCSHLVYGLESFDPGILKKLGKGTTRENNIRSMGECLNSGVIPVPNIIIGFPEETLESIRNTILALIELGIHAKPHFATAYPGSEWYYSHKQSIIEQYGNLESYILDLGDATKITGVISKNFTGAELVGLQDIVKNRNLRLLDQFSTRGYTNPSSQFFSGKI